MSSPEREVPTPPGPSVTVWRATRTSSEQVGELLVEGDVLAAAEDDEDVGQPEQGAGFVLAVGDDQLPPGLGGVDERDAQRAFVGHPGPQRRQRRGGGQLVEAGEERRAAAARTGERVGQRAGRCRGRARRRRSSAATRTRTGLPGRAGRWCRRAAIRSARSVAGRPGPGTQRRRISSWKNSAIACWTVVTVLPAVRSSPCSAPCSSPCQNGAACGCCAGSRSGWSAATRVGDPPQDVLEGAAGQRGGVEVAPAGPWRPRRRRTGPRRPAGRRRRRR